MYSFKELGGEGKQVGKGIVRAVLKNQISHEDYVATITGKKLSDAAMTTVRSDGHHIKTIQQRKITLSPFDDKRYIRDDGVRTYAHGHTSIEDIEFSRMVDKVMRSLEMEQD